MLYFEDESEHFNIEDDFVLIPANAEKLDFKAAMIFTTYKRVDRKIKPVSGTFPQNALVKRTFPHDPLEGLTILSKNPPDFVPTGRITRKAQRDGYKLNRILRARRRKII